MTGIVVQAYSPLVRMEKSNDPILVKVAQEVGKETTQVLIRWSLQKGYVASAASADPFAVRAEICFFTDSLLCPSLILLVRSKAILSNSECFVVRVVILTRSITVARIRQNADVYDFELSDEQMKTLDSLEAHFHVAPWNVNCD